LAFTKALKIKYCLNKRCVLGKLTSYYGNLAYILIDYAVVLRSLNFPAGNVSYLVVIVLFTQRDFQNCFVKALNKR